MRRFGIVLIGLGAATYYFCSEQLASAERIPPDTSIEDSLRYPAGRDEIGEYGGAMLVGVGVLMLLFPKGR